MKPPIQKTWAGVGLCAACLHVREIESRRGSRFFLCGLSKVDSKFPKYPRLPVLQCPGFEIRDQPGGPFRIKESDEP